MCVYTCVQVHMHVPVEARGSQQVFSQALVWKHALLLNLERMASAGLAEQGALGNLLSLSSQH